MTSRWKISGGYCGPTDCCLCLTHPNGATKEYLIESEAWKVLSSYKYYKWEEVSVCSDLAAALNLVWQNCDGDIKKKGWTLTEIPDS